MLAAVVVVVILAVLCSVHTNVDLARHSTGSTPACRGYSQLKAWVDVCVCMYGLTKAKDRKVDACIEKVWLLARWSGVELYEVEDIQTFS